MSSFHKVINHIVSGPILELYLTLSTTLKTLSPKPIWWHAPVIPVLGRLRQEAWEFKASLGCIGGSTPSLGNIERLSQKRSKTKKGPYFQIQLYSEGLRVEASVYEL
jgi:hypothetical protein